MKYEFELLKVNDADAIIICHYDEEGYRHLILVDAGNYNDGKTIKKHLQEKYGSLYIELAICTHPDDDHKGGFFYLLNDDNVEIGEFWLTDPAGFLTEEDIKYYRSKENACAAVRRIWENVNKTSENLIDMIEEKCGCLKSVVAGCAHDSLPVTIVAPNVYYYGEIVKQMVAEYGVKTYIESSTDKYDDAAEVDDDKVDSVIDTEEDDGSPYNASSLVVLYEPEEGHRVLIAGDSNRASLTQMLKDYPDLKKGVNRLKVPHHGSIHNLSTPIMKALKPRRSYISAIGNKKHPNNSIVYYLSNYGDVFSTHACNGYIHSHPGLSGRKGDKSLDPLKRKR